MSALTIFLFVLGLVLLLVGAEVLVRGASRLAAVFGISPLVIGLTVVAFGTSAPELGVSLAGALAGRADVAVGNVVGSNIFNILFVLGLAATITPLTVAQQLVRLDVPLLIGASLLLLVMALDGGLGRLDGLLLFAGVIAYTVFAVVKSRRESREIEAEYAQQYASSGPPRLLLQLGLIVGGLLLLVLGSQWLVQGAVAMATAFGVSDLVIALTIVAMGTSLPEVATSVVASVRGERDIAVGNVVGSSLFNILAVLGGSALIAPGSIAVSPDALSADLPFMVAVSIACLPIFFTGHRIARWEGILFLGFYGAYTLFVVLRAAEHPFLAPFTAAMVFFVAPLTAVTLGVITYRAFRRL